MNIPNMTPISECFIKPKYQVEESNKPYYLSPWDLILLSCHYNQKGLLFTKPNNPNFSIHNLLETLKDSLSLTLVHFYPLAGQLETNLDHNRHRSTIFVDCNKGPGVRFLHTTLSSTISDILSPTHVPSVVKSFFDLSNGEVNHDGHNKPLLSIQVTELTDGIFIGCSMNHVIVDGTSFWQFWNMWSEIHRGGSTQCPKPVHNRYVPEEYNIQDVFLPYTHPNEYITRFKPPQDLRERYFHFSSKAITNLKTKANSQTPQGEVTSSSFQALVALVWRSIIRSTCLPRDQVTKCNMAANNRTRLNPPLAKEYFGNSLGVIQVSTKVGELVGNELGWVTLLLNKNVAKHGDKSIRGFFNTWFQTPIVFQLSGRALENNSVQVGSSPRFEVYENEFSGLGKPVAVRSGHANKFAGKVNLFPGSEGGGSVDVEICLPYKTMSVLENDQEFMAAISSQI